MWSFLVAHTSVVVSVDEPHTLDMAVVPMIRSAVALLPLNINKAPWLNELTLQWMLCLQPLLEL